MLIGSPRSGCRRSRAVSRCAASWHQILDQNLKLWVLVHTDLTGDNTGTPSYINEILTASCDQFYAFVSTHCVMQGCCVVWRMPVACCSCNVSQLPRSQIRRSNLALTFDSVCAVFTFCGDQIACADQLAACIARDIVTVRERALPQRCLCKPRPATGALDMLIWVICTTVALLMPLGF